MIANMIEIHANATPFDAGVYLSSCDKGVPGNLIGMARVNIPAVFVPGGTMNAGPEMLTLEQLGMYSAKFERGEIGGGEAWTWASAMLVQAVVPAHLSEQHQLCRSWQRHLVCFAGKCTDASDKPRFACICA